MHIDPFLIWVESTALSQWVVGSPSVAFGFPGILTLHAIGMAFAAGLAAALDLRILGVARGIPLAEFRRFLPILWAGFWLNAVSGVLLLIGYPTKALTNPLFYVKLGLIATAMAILVHTKRVMSATPTEGTSDRTVRLLAAVSLLCWAGAIFAGRFLAYTYSRLTAIE
jgi:hypothetical protein